MLSVHVSATRRDASEGALQSQTGLAGKKLHPQPVRPHSISCYVLAHEAGIRQSP